MARLGSGMPVPDVELQTMDGATLKLSDLKGERVVLYFYPKDDTSGCTAQACAYRDAHDDLASRGVRVIGVSPDPARSHERFRAKYDLNFTLLSDPDHTAAEAFGVWVEKRMYGRTYMGVERSTFLIAPDGIIEDARYKVKPEEDTAVVLGLLGS